MIKFIKFKGSEVSVYTFKCVYTIIVIPTWSRTLLLLPDYRNACPLPLGIIKSVAVAIVFSSETTPPPLVILILTKANETVLQT